MAKIPETTDSLPINDLRGLLGVSPHAKDEEIRQAYLQKIKEYPPDRDPEAFEQIRDAYEMLRDPVQRTFHMLGSLDPNVPLLSLLQHHLPERRFTGPKPWLNVLKEG